MIWILLTDLFVITADTAYYFYVNDDWNGASDGSVGFMAGFNQTNFYYTVDGMNNLGRFFCDHGRYRLLFLCVC